MNNDSISMQDFLTARIIESSVEEVLASTEKEVRDAISIYQSSIHDYVSLAIRAYEAHLRAEELACEVEMAYILMLMTKSDEELRNALNNLSEVAEKSLKAEQDASALLKEVESADLARQINLSALQVAISMLTFVKNYQA